MKKNISIVAFIFCLISFQVFAQEMGPKEKEIIKAKLIDLSNDLLSYTEDEWESRFNSIAQRFEERELYKIAEHIRMLAVGYDVRDEILEISKIKIDRMSENGVLQLFTAAVYYVITGKWFDPTIMIENEVLTQIYLWLMLLTLDEQNQASGI